jgi:hypothetical protein
MKLLSILSFALGALFTMGSTSPAAWLGDDPHRVPDGPPDAWRWPAAVAAVAPGLPAPELATASTADVRRFFARLSGTQRDLLARRIPGVVGNLDGAPDELRFAANGYAAGAAGPAVNRGGGRPAGRLLGYDPRGDGRLIEVFGDLGRARHVAVLVPGSGWGLDSVLLGVGPAGADPVANAQALRGEARRLDPGARVAAVVWLGYDAPEDIDRQAARSERAVAGGRALAGFVAGLPRGAHVTLLCHSYGAVVCGRAAPAAPVGDLVVIAAPGMDVRSADELRTGARLWAARNAGDPIRFVPKVRLGGFGHATDPIDPRFGARVFRTGRAHGHDAYYAAGTESLANLARIALGHHSEVTLA